MPLLPFSISTRYGRYLRLSGRGRSSPRSGAHRRCAVCGLRICDDDALAPVGKEAAHAECALVHFAEAEGPKRSAAECARAAARELRLDLGSESCPALVQELLDEQAARGG